MALTTCNECDASVSTVAKSCPQCGAKGKALTGHLGFWATVGYAFLILIGLSTVVGFLSSWRAQMHPQTKKSAEDQKQDKHESIRINMAMGAARALKASLRNPDSLVLEKVLATETGDAICIRYRAQNGFGGMNRDIFVFTDQDSYTSASAWNRHCRHRQLYDYSDTLPQMMHWLG